MKDEGQRFLKLVQYKRSMDIWVWVQEPKCCTKTSQKLRDAYQTWAKTQVSSESGNEVAAHSLTDKTLTSYPRRDMIEKGTPSYFPSSSVTDASWQSNEHDAPGSILTPQEIVHSAIKYSKSGNELNPVQSFNSIAVNNTSSQHHNATVAHSSNAPDSDVMIPLLNMASLQIGTTLSYQSN